MPSGPLDRAFGDAQHPPAGQAADPGADAVADFLVQFRLAHHAALADPALADLELGLDQRDQAGAGPGQRQGRRQHHLEADETGIADHEIDRIGDQPGVQAAGIGLFHHRDPGIGAQFPGQLAMADIDRIDPGRPPGQQDIGKAAGGGADIDGGQAGRIDGEFGQALFELQPPARDPGVRLALHFQRQILGDLVAGLVEAPGAGEDLAGHDDGLGLGPAFGQAPVDQQLIEADLGHAPVPNKAR